MQSLSASQQRYVLNEMMISAGVNAALSLAFALLVFGQSETVPIWGVGGLVFDSVPQSFMVLFMGTLVPSLVMRKRIATGRLPDLGLLQIPRPRHLMLRASLSAFAGTAVAASIHTAVLPAVSSSIVPFTAMLIYKIIYGAVLGAMATGFAVHFCLTFASDHKA
jgi:hypothetical protein